MVKEKKTVSEKLSLVWKARMSLYAEGAKLWAEGDKLWAEGAKLRAEGAKLYAEGDKLWAEAVIEARGNIKMEWKNWHKEKSSYECHLETGEVFIP